jgi:beta-galactosidase
MSALMDSAGIKSPFEVPRGVELCVRKSGGAQWLFLLNHTAAPQTVTHPGKFKELLTGATSKGKLTLDAYDVRVLQPI